MAVPDREVVHGELARRGCSGSGVPRVRPDTHEMCLGNPVEHLGQGGEQIEHALLPNEGPRVHDASLYDLAGVRRSELAAVDRIGKDGNVLLRESEEATGLAPGVACYRGDCCGASDTSRLDPPVLPLDRFPEEPAEVDLAAVDA